MPNSPFNNRLHYALIIAIILHGLGILGIGFSYATSNKIASMEVTLAKFEAEQADPEADYYAQVDQLGGGSEETKKLLSDTELAVTRQADSSPSEQKSTDQTEIKSTNDTIFTAKKDTLSVIISKSSDHELSLNQLSQSSNSVSENRHADNLNQQIVALKSQIAMRRQILAKALKKRTITTMSTKSHQDAAYLEKWRKRIVSIGNIHYPKAANEQKIYGSVRLLIAMQANGDVKSIEILESSGTKILDHGAVKIIRLAAPFAPFSAQMRKNTDVLEIIRTIEFEKSTLIY